MQGTDKNSEEEESGPAPGHGWGPARGDLEAGVWWVVARAGVRIADGDSSPCRPALGEGLRDPRRARAKCKGYSLRGTQGLQTAAAKVRGDDSRQKLNSSQKAETSRSQSHPKWVWKT